MGRHMSFNLIAMPWLPCHMLSNDGTELLNLRQVFERSADIGDIVTTSVSEGAALRRFLLAVFIRVYKDHIQHWKESPDTVGPLPMKPFDDYVGEWSHRFELFHPERPFYQHIQPLSEKKQSLNKLVFEDASGANAVWFSHRHEEDGRTMTNAEAVRALITAQVYAVGGGVSKPFNFSHGTLISGGIVFWIAGRNLLESLLLNVPQACLQEDEADGMPAWERPSIHAEQRVDTGLLDLLTFQSRRLLLTRVDDDRVDGVFLSQGDKDLSVARDPMMAYYMNDKDEERILNLDREKALWREYQILYATAESGSSRYHPPQVLQEHRNAFDPSSDEPVHIDILAFGVQTDKGKIEHSHMERFPFYPGIAADPDNRDRLDNLLHTANGLEKNLDQGLWQFAKTLLHPDKANLGDIERREVGALKNSFSWKSKYWSVLGTLIHDYISRLARSRSTDERDDIAEEWRRECRHTAERVLKNITDSYGTTARSARAAAIAHAAIRREFAAADVA